MQPTLIPIEHSRGSTDRDVARNALAFLAEASAALGSSLDYRQTIALLSQLVVKDVADFCSCALLQDGTVEIVARAARGEGRLDEPAVRYRLSTLDPVHPVAQALLDGKPSILTDISDAWIRSVSVSNAQVELLRRLDLKSIVIAPMVARSRIFGAFALGFSREDARVPDSEDVEFALELGRRAGTAIDNAMLHQAVTASEERHRMLSETVPQLVWTCRSDGYCEYLNRRWVEYTGVPAERHLGWNWGDALHPDDRDAALHAWRKASADGSDYSIEYRMRRFDGVYRWFKARGLPLRDGNHEITRWFGTSTDIDDQKRAQQADRESRERLTAALTASNTGTFRWDIVTNELDWDENLDRLFGLPPGQTARALENFVAMVHPDDRAGVLERCARCASEAADFEMEFRVIWHEGSVHWLYDRGKTACDESGRPKYMTGACVDITDRIRAEEEVRETGRYVAELLEALPQMVWTTDADGLVEYVNSQWRAYTGLTAEAIAKRGWHEVFHAEDLADTSVRWGRALQSGSTYEAEHRMRGTDGEYRWFLSRGVPLRNASGQIVRWFGSSTDISSQKAAEQERAILLQRESDARAQAESAAAALSAANEELQHFVFAAAHDLRAPLRTMSAFSELLNRHLGAAADESTTNYLRYIASGATRMNQLLNDLLAYSKVGTGAADLDGSVDLDAIRAAVVSSLKVLIEENRAEIVSERLPVVRGSASQLTSVIQNLISNAIKYRKPEVPPRVTFRVTVEGNYYRFAIEDNGQGFRPEYSETIFGAFKRLHGPEIDGTGIGLALCRRVIERHGGKIWAASEPGAGSTFYFTLPVPADGN